MPVGRLTASALTNIGEPGLNNMSGQIVRKYNFFCNFALPDVTFGRRVRIYSVWRRHMTY